MKVCFFLLVCFISSMGFAQDNHIVKIEDGRSVLLNADFTWEYIDSENSGTIKSKKSTSCNLAVNYSEPQLNKKIQAQLKKGRATMSHVKKKVAKAHNCDVKDVVLLSVSEQKSKATYTFCVNGEEVAYKRIGNAIIKKEKLF
ncbi:DUF3157 domain-containing protein [Algibacter marinivivus]|uniref:DUF3157 domain-containing protein n=1 Tax=Algibacter marinivivus TaxID=2100723 RepID=A0A2U2X7H9_9FLAO|nr:DUF3157 family protein [Algibacter marinivivus]PWH83738.1 DUF3157 domain-containing protein [Algibacter marinivivus]